MAICTQETSGSYLPQPVNRTLRTLPPILVVGMSRSGTKWLSNILCSHPDIVGAQSERHCGIIETSFFGQADEVFGDLSSTDHYIALVELFARTDFFRATGVDKGFLYTMRPRPSTPSELFTRVMNQFRDVAGARTWVQKMNPHWGAIAADGMPESRLVIIRRGFENHLKSSVKLHKTIGLKTPIWRFAAAYAFRERVLKRLAARRAAYWIEYEDLAHNRDKVVTKLFAHLGLDAPAEVFSDRFRKNSSFSSARESAFALKKGDLLLAKSVYYAARRAPLSLFGLHRAFLRSRRLEFARGTFAELSEENPSIAHAA